MAEREGFRLLGTDAVEDALDRITAAIHAQLGPDVGEANVEVHVPPYEDDFSLWIRRRPE